MEYTDDQAGWQTYLYLFDNGHRKLPVDSGR